MSIYERVKQWFFSDAIAGEKQFLIPFVPDRKRKHAAKVFRAVSAVLIVGMNDRFGVAVGIKGVAEFFELLAELEIVVDLAVENYPGGAVLIVDGLLSADPLT